MSAWHAVLPLSSLGGHAADARLPLPAWIDHYPSLFIVATRNIQFERLD